MGTYNSGNGPNLVEALERASAKRQSNRLTMKNGKPGEIWRVTENSKWAKWLVLDGELRRQGQELGYKNPVVCVELHTPYDNHKMDPSEFCALADKDEQFFNQPASALWEKLVN